MSAKLYQIINDTGRTLYCGPAAICAVTGLPASHVLRTVNIVRREPAGRAVRGMCTSEVRATLELLGLARVYAVETMSRPTLSRWRRERPSGVRAAVAIVTTTTHFLVIAGNRLVDSNHHDPIMASDYRKQRARVRSVIFPHGVPA